MPSACLEEKIAVYTGMLPITQDENGLAVVLGHEVAHIPFWQRMNEKARKRPPEFLSTHPEPMKRIEDIRNELPEAMKYYKQSTNKSF